MFKSFLLELNISAVKTNYIFSVNSNDLNTIRLDLVIKDNAALVDLTGKIVRLAIRKPDHTVVFQSGGVTDGPGGECEFILEKQASLVPGRHEAEVMIYEGDSSVAVTTKFYYEVKRAALLNSDVESSSDFPAISQAIAAGEILKEIDIHSVIEAGAIAGGVQEEMNLAKQKEDGTLFGSVQERLNDSDAKTAEQFANNAKKTENIINPLIPPYKAKGDGTNETGIFTTILNDIGTTKKTILIPVSFRFSQNVTFPENVTLKFENGGMLNIDSGVTAIIKGEIQAGNHVIFAGQGLVDKSTSSTPYNVAWYEGVSLNKKWDKMSANFNDFIQKNIKVPKPSPNQIGAIKPSGAVERWWWLLDAPLIINDYCSLAKIYFEGELYAPTNIGTGVIFGISDVKPETIHLPLGLSVQADGVNRLSIGIEIRSIARITIDGIIDVNNADKGLVIGGVNHNGNIGEITINTFHCGLPKISGIEIYGKGGTKALLTVSCNQVMIENAPTSGCDAVVIKGATRNIDFNDIYYITNNGVNCKSAFVVQNTIEGTPLLTTVDSIYVDKSDDYAVRTDDLTGSTPQIIEGLSVTNIHTIGKGVGLYATKSASITNVSGGSEIYIDSTCIYTNVRVTNRNRTIIDNGQLSIINGYGKRAYGAGTTPDTAQWTIGNTVVNTTDKTVWLKFQETGVSANDFIKLN